MIAAPQHASPSRRWLAHLVAAAHAGEARGEPFRDAPAFDAADVLELARCEQIAPMIHLGCVQQRIGEALPVAFRAGCEAAYYRSLHANIVGLTAGKRILDAFRFADVAAAPIDGWAVLQGPFRYYPDAGSRPLEALDLMIREPDRERAGVVLSGLGYRPGPVGEAPGRPAGKVVFRSPHDSQLPVVLRSGWEGIASPASRVAISGDDFLDHLCDTTVFGYHRPTRTANLVVASVRAAGDGCGRWLRLADVHHLISAAPLDWEELLAGARRWRVRAPLYAALVAARDLYGTAVPRTARNRLAPGPVRRRLLHRSLAACHRRGATTAAARALLGESWWEVARAAARGAQQAGWGG